MDDEKSPLCPMATLSLVVTRAARRHEAQLTRERLQAEWRAKKRPTKEQAVPVGLFEQRQETLDL